MNINYVRRERKWGRNNGVKCTVEKLLRQSVLLFVFILARGPNPRGGGHNLTREIFLRTQVKSQWIAGGFEPTISDPSSYHFRTLPTTPLWAKWVPLFSCYFSQHNWFNRLNVNCQVILNILLPNYETVKGYSGSDNVWNWNIALKNILFKSVSDVHWLEPTLAMNEWTRQNRFKCGGTRHTARSVQIQPLIRFDHEFTDVDKFSLSHDSNLLEETHWEKNLTYTFVGSML